METVIATIRNGGQTSIKVNEISLDKVDIHIEKTAAGGLNLWAALGAESPEEESAVQNSVVAAMAAVGGGALHTGHAIGSAAIHGIVDTSHLACKGVSNIENLANKCVSGGFKLVSKGIGGTMCKKKKKKKKTKTAEEEEGEDMYGRRELDQVEEEEGEEGMEENMDDEDGEVGEEEEMKEGVVGGEEGDGVGDIGTVEDDVEGDEEEEEEVEEEANNKGDKKEANNHFGIPYKLEIDRLSIFNLRLHAADFVAASHMKSSKMFGDIRIVSMNMLRRELTKKGKGGSNRRKGIYFDEVVWRLVNQLISELRQTNKIAMTTLLAMGSVSHASAAVSGVVTGAASGAERVVAGAAGIMTGAAKGVTSTLEHMTRGQWSHHSNHKGKNSD